MTSKKKDFYTVKEFSEYLGVHYHTVLNGIKCGRIQAFRVGRGAKASFRIPHSEINRLSIFDMQQVIQDIIHKKKD